MLDVARTVAGADPDVEDMIEAALEPMLLSLSTTHFGLASPTLHPDREESALGHIGAAEEKAGAAMELALADLNLEQDEFFVVNYRNSSGPALVELPLQLPASGSRFFVKVTKSALLVKVWSSMVTVIPRVPSCEQEASATATPSDGVSMAS